jgi:hypothetical protein
MNKLSRLTVRTVRQAYEKTCLKPKLGVTLGTVYACPIGVVAAARGLKGNDPVLLGKKLGLSVNYIWPFMRGFDSGKVYSQAGADGRAIRRALLGFKRG